SAGCLQRLQESGRVLAALEHLDEGGSDDDAVRVPTDQLDLGALADAEAGANGQIGRGLDRRQVRRELFRQRAASAAGDTRARDRVQETGGRRRELAQPVARRRGCDELDEREPACFERSLKRTAFLVG